MVAGKLEGREVERGEEWRGDGREGDGVYRREGVDDEKER